MASKNRTRVGGRRILSSSRRHDSKKSRLWQLHRLGMEWLEPRRMLTTSPVIISEIGAAGTLVEQRRASPRIGWRSPTPAARRRSTCRVTRSNTETLAEDLHLPEYEPRSGRGSRRLLRLEVPGRDQSDPGIEHGFQPFTNRATTSNCSITTATCSLHSNPIRP